MEEERYGKSWGKKSSMKYKRNDGKFSVTESDYLEMAESWDSDDDNG